MILNIIKFKILKTPRTLKRSFVILVDIILCILAVWIAYYLRTGEFILFWERYNEHYLLPAYIISIFISISVFSYFDLYKLIFRFAGSQTMINFAKAAIIYGFVYCIIFTLHGIDGVPRTIGIIQPIILFFLISISRFFAVYWLGDMYKKSRNINNKKVLIYGAGSAGRQLAAALRYNNNVKLVGFLDDNSLLQGNKLNGLTIHDPNNIEKLILRENINEIILALPLINGYRRQKIISKFQSNKIIIRTLPSFEDLIQGRIKNNDISDLSIDKILGRDLIAADPILMQQDIKNKIVLVTGAGGSIGSELCRQIYLQKPKTLILLDHSEYALHTIYEELKMFSFNYRKKTGIVACLGSITDKNTIKQIFKKHKPETIFHAAAYKHVPIVEYNKFEGLKNNIFGTLNLSEVAISFGVKKFVLISTDKAVRPSNVMGASKRLSEMIIQALSSIQDKTLFTIVRFGNVLESSGSVVPLFRSQIKSGGPLTVTHPEVTRYFMTISEAAQLVIQAGAMTKNKPKAGKATPIYILDMGNPIKILDLAMLMINFSGFTVFDNKTGEGDIKIKFIGLRKGEKLSEELLIGDNLNKSPHSKINYAYEEFLSWDKLNYNLTKINKSINDNNEKLVIKDITTLVSGSKK